MVALGKPLGPTARKRSPVERDEMETDKALTQLGGPANTAAVARAA